MRKRFIFPVVALFVAFLCEKALATVISNEDALKAARAFVTSDAIGSTVLKDRSVMEVAARGMLFIASLSPSGHIILSGSDLADPIVGFSKNDFVEPDPDSPALSVLASAEASAIALEYVGGERHAKWTKLLGGGMRRPLLQSTEVPDSAVVVEPFLLDHFDQCQPYNDYCPVYESSTNDLDYCRGRCPCGCVATAAAQVFHHLKWPARIDNTISFDHEFIDENDTTYSFPLRFDGHLPIDWNAIDNYYDCYTVQWVTNYYPDGDYSYWQEYNFDLRGTVDESTRYPISRLLLWCDVLSKMEFTPSTSWSNYRNISSNVQKWYTEGTWLPVANANYYNLIVNDLTNGIPLQVELKAHQVVAHGWAGDEENSYIYLNYGYGGSNDGYYNMNNSDLNSDSNDYAIYYAIESIYVGHYPRAKPQLDPLPKVCGTNVTLSWHFPDIYTNNLNGFSASMTKTATSESTFVDDFSATHGSSDAESGSINNGEYDKLFVSTDETYGTGHGNLLYAEPYAVGIFTFPDRLTITSSSVLSFNLRSVNANACSYQVQASFDNGAWETLAEPELALYNGYTSDSGWQSYQVPLGDHIGQSATFRILKQYIWGEMGYGSGRILLDDFTVSNVLEQEAAESYEIGSTARCFQVPELQEGGVYTFTVTPSLLDEEYALTPAETSTPVSTTISSSRALGMPEILSVSTVKEGFYAECGTNATTFTVQCSSSVTNLCAFPSHLSLVSDDDVSVSEMGNGVFKVCLTPSGINETNFRSRMILTLVGTDANGTKCYKDLSLRFEPTEETVSEVVVKAKTSTGEEYNVSIPYEWLETCGLVQSGSDASGYEAALASTADADGDGLPNWAEFVCGTSPTNAEDKLTISIEMVNGKPKVEYSNTQIAGGFEAVLKGTTDISTAAANWEVVTETTTSTHRFFRVEIVPEN